MSGLESPFEICRNVNMLSKNKANVFLDFFGVSFLLLTGISSCVLTGGCGGGIEQLLI